MYRIVYKLANSDIIDVMFVDTGGTSLSKHLEEVPSTRVGDRRLRRHKRQPGIFRMIAHTRLKLTGKFRRR